MPDPKFMSGREAVQLLVDIVVKGGNLLLNIGPAPDGTWPEGAYTLLNEMGKWMKDQRRSDIRHQGHGPLQRWQGVYQQQGR
ncbi:MAG: alpha-L-fucosidase [Bacteroidales bacterium]|nr:alpha-L-fucosidase [Bacteroidales bacterium]